MTRTLLSLTLVCCTATCIASAEPLPRGDRSAAPTESSPSTPHPTIGGYWSTNLSTATLPPGLGQVVSRGWSGGGVTVGVPLGGRWSFDMSAMWNRKGARLQPHGVDGFLELTANYVSAPLLLTVKTGGGIRPYISGGFEVSRLLSASTHTKLGPISVTENSTAALKPWDLAAAISGGIERETGRGTLFGGMLYSHGLRNVLADSSDVDWAKTRTLTVVAGIRF